MVNNGQPKLPVNRKVGYVDMLFCAKCKKEYPPCPLEISTKNPNIYYKQCKECRSKNSLYHRNYVEKKNLLKEKENV